jgi:hypothetical protein
MHLGLKISSLAHRKSANLIDPFSAVEDQVQAEACLFSPVLRILFLTDDFLIASA